MEVRIAKMEQEIALMSQTQEIMSEALRSVSVTLQKMSNIQLDTKLLEERWIHMDRDLQESFERVHKRIDQEANARMWATRIVLGGFLVALVSFVVKGGVV